NAPRLPHPEIFKRVAFWMIEDADVRLLLHTFCVDSIIKDGVIEGIVVENKNGRGAILADVVIDASGDGDVAARAGVPFALPISEDGKTQPMTLMFHIGGVDIGAFLSYKLAHPDQFKGEAGLYDLIKKATAAGDLDLPREDILFFKLPRRGEIVVNSTRVLNVLGIDAWDLTHAEMESRNQAVMILKFFKQYVPGFTNAYVIQTATQIGVRETRRILGEYVLKAEDVLFDSKFDDVVARAAYPIDIHNPDGKGTVMVPLEPGSSYDIPYRSIVPQKIDNLLVAGKCMSGTHEAQASFRVIPTSMATGQAAGVAAALSVKRGDRPREIVVAELQLELLKQNVVLGPNVTREGLEAALSKPRR
ncbi:MAG: FAD-dependent oxidoreductase, partial [Actinobacteria bacterium]|nr:FAD-dependent oxidoreductase [Actinomycetota bacterium]